MKKVDITFVCDRCKKPLPEKYVKKNQNGENYFDLHGFNTIKLGGGSTAGISIQIDVSEYGPTFRELCNECRIHCIEMVLERMRVLNEGESDG